MFLILRGKGIILTNNNDKKIINLEKYDVNKIYKIKHIILFNNCS